MKCLILVLFDVKNTDQVVGDLVALLLTLLHHVDHNGTAHDTHNLPLHSFELND